MSAPLCRLQLELVPEGLASSQLRKCYTSDQGTILLGRGGRHSSTAQLANSGSFRDLETERTAVMSSQHAQVTWGQQDTYAFLTDKGSTNGTYLSKYGDSEPPLKLRAGVSYRLDDGDVVTFGRAVPTVKHSAKTCVPLPFRVKLRQIPVDSAPHQSASSPARSSSPIETGPSSAKLTRVKTLTSDDMSDNHDARSYHRRHRNSYGLSERDILQDQNSVSCPSDNDDDAEVTSARASSPVSITSSVISARAWSGVESNKLSKFVKDRLRNAAGQQSPADYGNDELSSDDVIIVEEVQVDRQDSRKHTSPTRSALNSDESVDFVYQFEEADMDEDPEAADLGGRRLFIGARHLVNQVRKLPYDRLHSSIGGAALVMDDDDVEADEHEGISRIQSYSDDDGHNFDQDGSVSATQVGGARAGSLELGADVAEDVPSDVEAPVASEADASTDGGCGSQPKSDVMLVPASSSLGQPSDATRLADSDSTPDRHMPSVSDAISELDQFRAKAAAAAESLRRFFSSGALFDTESASRPPSPVPVEESNADYACNGDGIVLPLNGNDHRSSANNTGRDSARSRLSTPARDECASQASHLPSPETSGSDRSPDVGSDVESQVSSRRSEDSEVDSEGSMSDTSSAPDDDTPSQSEESGSSDAGTDSASASFNSDDGEDSYETKLWNDVGGLEGDIDTDSMIRIAEAAETAAAASARAQIAALDLIVSVFGSNNGKNAQQLTATLNNLRNEAGAASSNEDETDEELDAGALDESDADAADWDDAVAEEVDFDDVHSEAPADEIESLPVTRAASLEPTPAPKPVFNISADDKLKMVTCDFPAVDGVPAMTFTSERKFSEDGTTRVATKRTFSATDMVNDEVDTSAWMSNWMKASRDWADWKLDHDVVTVDSAQVETNTETEPVRLTAPLPKSNDTRASTEPPAKRRRRFAPRARDVALGFGLGVGVGVVASIAGLSALSDVIQAMDV